jgi:hypothetical protein
MKHLVWILILLLVILHQDYWAWDNSSLVFGWLPYPLAYHAGLSLAAACVWWLATRFCWPAGLEPRAEELPAEGDPR